MIPAAQGKPNRNQNLTLGIHCIDGFLFKEDGNVLILQLADVFQAVQRVSDCIWSDSQRFWAFRRYPCSGKL